MWLINFLNTTLDHIDDTKAYLMTVDPDRILAATIIALFVTVCLKWCIDTIYFLIRNR